MRAVAKLGESRRARRLSVSLAVTALTTAALVTGSHPAAAARADNSPPALVPAYMLYIVSHLPVDVTYVTVNWVDANQNVWTTAWPTFGCGSGQQCAITDNGYYLYVPGDQPTVQAWHVYGTPADLPVTAMTGQAGYVSGSYYVCYLYSRDGQLGC